MVRTEAAIELSGLTRIHAVGTLTVMALPPVDLTVDRGEWVALRGPSGSGKSTLLHLVAGLDRPTAGTVDVMGARLAGNGKQQLPEGIAKGGAASDCERGSGKASRAELAERRQSGWRQVCGRELLIARDDEHARMPIEELDD